MSFCSTILPWERSSNGDEYQKRYPAGFVLADTIGTQSGCVPRVIVSTVSPKLPVADQVRSLIANSFAYGLMIHADQGVRRGFEEYQKARDSVFSFGYGPCRITDVMSGLLLEKPEIALKKYGYALLLIEKGNAPTAEEIKANNRKILGETIVYDRPEQLLQEDTSRPAVCKDGIYSLSGVTRLIGSKAIEVEPDRSYTLSGEFRKDTDETMNTLLLAVMFLDKQGKRIPTGQYMSIPGSLTTTAAVAKTGSTEALVRKVPGFGYNRGCSAVMALRAAKDESDLPNKALTPRIRKLEWENDLVRVTFTAPLTCDIPAGTPVRLHYSYWFDRPVPEMRWYNRPTREWQKFGGKVIIPPAGAKSLLPVLVYTSSGKNEKGHIEVRNLQLKIR